MNEGPPSGPDMTQGAIYRFDDVEVDLAAHQVRRDGVEVALEPKAFAVLAALLEHAGSALERDDLLDRVWRHRHVTPGVLNRVIAQLRKALGDNAEHPRYIQTLHSLGYRFIAEVERVEPRADPEISPPQITAPMPSTTVPVGSEVAESAYEQPARNGRLVSSVHAPGRRASDKSASRRLLLPVLFFVALLAMFAVLWLQQTQAPVNPEVSIAVLPFTSLSSDPNDSYFAEGLAVEMHDALAGVPGLTVAAQLPPGSDVRNEDAKALGQRLGVATVLDASVRREGGRLRISARLSDTATGYTLWNRRYDRSVSDVFATQTEIAYEVVTSLIGAMPESQESLRSRLMPTHNVAAFDAYLRGLQQLLRPESGGEGVALSLFGQALAKDGGFARAQAGICRSQLSIFENRRNAEAFERARAACLRAQEMDPMLSEVQLALGELYHAQGNLGKAVEYYTKAEADPARRASVYVGLALVHADQGRSDQALTYFQRALKARPGDPAIYTWMGYHYYLKGDFEKAISAYRKAAALQPNDADKWAYLGGIYLAAGDETKAAAVLERSIGIRPNYVALSNLGEIRYQEGNYAAAVDLHREATQLDPSDYQTWGNLAQALLADPRNAPQAQAAFREAEVRARKYTGIKSSDAKALAALGWYLANLGQDRVARQMVRRSEELGSEPAEVAWLNAQTLVQLGDIEQARKRISAARAAGITERRITTNTVLRGLSAHPTSGSRRQSAPEERGHPSGE